MNTSISIQGQTFNSPKNCTVEVRYYRMSFLSLYHELTFFYTKDRDIYGYWEVDNQAECNPYWDAPQPSVRCHSYDTSK